MPFCNKCGHRNNDTAKFCIKCGNPMLKKVSHNFLTSAIEVVVEGEKPDVLPMKNDKSENLNLHNESIVAPNEDYVSKEHAEIVSNYVSGIELDEAKKTSLKKVRLPILAIALIGIVALIFYLLFENEKSKVLSNKTAVQTDSLKNGPVSVIQQSAVTADSVKKSSPGDKIVNQLGPTKSTTEEIKKPVNSVTKQESNLEISPVEEPENLNTKSSGNFQYLSVKQISNDLDYKPMCEGITYNEEVQKFVVLGGLPDKKYQEKLDQFRNITIKIQFRSVSENKDCNVEVFYKKLGNKFEFVAYAEK